MLIRNEINQGLAKSINRGVHQSKAPYILMTNNDIYAPKDAIPRLLNLLRRDSRYGASAPAELRVSTQDPGDGYGDCIE